MSALGGYFSRSGAGVDSRLLRRLSAEMAQIGPDGESFEVSTKVGMLFRPFFTHDEVRRAPRPVVDHEGFMITFDGWLDNRGEIVTALGSDLPWPSPTVPELVLAVYKRWGIAGFAKLIGNFAFALWDSHAEQLYLTADSLGMRPLYYYLDEERVVWSSRARALMVAREAGVEIEVEYLAAFLANSITNESPFKNIQVVPGGHTLVVGRERARMEKYWSFDPRLEIQYARDSDYEEHLVELFETAVRCRSNNDGPVFAELSGGVDSSSIVCVADHLLQRGLLQNKELHTVSYVFDKTPSADERAYIWEIEQGTSSQNHHILESNCPILRRPPSGFGPDLPTMRIVSLAYSERLNQHLEAHGSRVVLSGVGGDQAFLSEGFDVPLELADLWVQRRPWAMVRMGVLWARVLRSSLPVVLWKGVALPLLESGRRIRTDELLPPEDWFETTFLERYKFRERSFGPRPDPDFRLPSRADHHSRLKQTMRHFALHTTLSHSHFEIRYPYLDRRILEFALSTPLNQKLRPREGRSVVRRALRDRVPSAVIQRRTKAGPAEAFQRAMIREQQWIDDLFKNPILEQLGVISADAFRSGLARARHGIVKQTALMHVVVALELWLRSLQDCSAEPTLAYPIPSMGRTA